MIGNKIKMNNRIKYLIIISRLKNRNNKIPWHNFRIFNKILITILNYIKRG